jgi:hypothetical protein
MNNDPREQENHIESKNDDILKLIVRFFSTALLSEKSAFFIPSVHFKNLIHQKI